MNDSKDTELRLEAGLTYAGVNDDGEEEWIGTRRQWQDYENMLRGDALSEEEVY